MAIIEAQNLTKVFKKGVTAVDHVSFGVEEGEIFGFLGPNGAGKTTTIKMLTTQTRPTQGRAIVGGRDVAKEPNEVRRVIGVVPQQLTVDDDLTGNQNLALQSKLYHLPNSLSRERMIELLDLVDLTSVAKRDVKTYSGGMRKRLQLILGLINHPKILFLDEPTLGLDIQTREAMWNYIRRLSSENNMTVFLTTHYLEEADALCQRVGIIDKGKIMVIGSPQVLKDGLGGDIVNLSLAAASEGIAEAISNLPFVKGLKQNGALYSIRVHKGEEVIAIIIELVGKLGGKVAKITLEKPSLDQVFLDYTGRAVRDEQDSSDSRMLTRNMKRLRE